MLGRAFKSWITYTVLPKLFSFGAYILLGIVVFIVATLLWQWDS